MSSVQEVINRSRKEETMRRMLGKRASYETMLKAETVAFIMQAYCPDGQAVEYETLKELHDQLVEESR